MARIVDEVGEDTKILFKNFLNEFSSTDLRSDIDTSSDVVRMKDYVEQAEEMKRHELTTMYVDFTHINLYNDQLAIQIESEYAHVDPFFTCCSIRVHKTAPTRTHRG